MKATFRSFSPPGRLVCRFIGLLVLAGLGLVVPGARAQAPALVLRGMVVDADTRQPVPHARLSVGGGQVGTSANADGRFVLPVPAAYRAGTLEVAMLGYARYRQPLPAPPAAELRIELRPQPTALGEVTISGSVLGLVREAVARIPQNYPGRPTRLEGFFRESDNELPTDKYLYLAEAQLTVYKAPYTQPDNDGAIVIQQSRKVDLAATAPLRSFWYAGPFVPHRFDFVHNRLDFINETHFKNYDYRLSDLTTYAGRPVYVISFGPRPGNERADFAGQLFIDQGSYAFLAAEWHRTPAGIRHEHISFDSQERAYRVEYQPYAGRWHLNSVWYHTRGQGVSGKELRHLSEFLTTAIDTTQRPAPGYTERAQFRDVFLQNTVRYDSAFWEGYATLLPPEQLRRALREQRRQQQAEQLFAAPAAQSATSRGPLLLTLLDRLRFGSYLGVLAVQARAAEVGLQVAPVGSAFRAEAQRRVPAPALVPWRGYSYQLRPLPHVEVQYTSRRVFGSFRGRGWELGASYEYNLRPRQRPVLLRAGLAYTRQRLGYDFGTFDNPDRNLQVAGTSLGAKRLGLALQQRTDAWLPRLGLGVELSHRVELTADLGVLLAPRTRTELQLSEKSGFFLTRHQTAAPLAEVGAAATVAGEAAPLPWSVGRTMLSVGLSYRLR